MQIRKKIRLTLAICVAAMSFGFTALAQITEVNCEISYGVITFSGHTDAVEQRVAYTASPKNSEDILSIGEPQVHEDGNFTIAVGFKESDDYTIKIRDASGHVYEKDIDGYICLADRQEILLDIINEGDAEDIAEALDEINFNFDGTDWTQISDENLTSWILSNIKEHRRYSNFGDFESEYAKLNALYIINKSKVADIALKIKTYAEVLGISENNDVKSFLSQQTNAKKSDLVKRLSQNPATLPSELTDAIEKANKVTGSPLGGSQTGGNAGGSGGAGSIGSIKTDHGKETDKSTDNENTEIKDTFSDIANAEWAREAIEALYERKIISGDENHMFRPNDSITREEFVKMVVVAFDIPYEDKECKFLDVFENDWFFSYVGAAQECGIVNGISDDIFGIRKQITRQDAAVILKRAADYAGINLEASREYEEFADCDDISDYAVGAVETLYKNGVISGREDKSFAPHDTCTRAETAKMIYGII